MLRTLPALLLLGHATLFAAGRHVVDDDTFVDNATAAAVALHEKGKLVPLTKLRGHLDRKTVELKRPEPRTDRLAPGEIFRLIKESTVVVATFHHCEKCKDWHFDSASGFVAADGVVSTSEHVVNFEDEEIKDGYLVIADALGNVYPATEILASDDSSDTCLLKVPGLSLKPLPLNLDARVGDRVYCLSHPEGNHWMFTEGMLSRFFLNREAASDGDAPPPEKKIKPSLYINITAEYSPGSSGAPVVDECGNVVGQVESITSTLEEEAKDKEKTIKTSYGMPLRSCVSAEEISKLMKPPAKVPKSPQ